MTPPASSWKGVTLGFVLVVAAVMTGLVAVDRLLAGLEFRDVRGQAARLNTEGDALLAAHRPAEAAPRFARAHALVREDRGYALNYARALLTSGDPERARDTLHELLDQQPSDGRANLLMARTLVSLNQLADADFFYHRAVYGSWPAASARRDRDSARLELSNWLASRPRNNDELLAELLSLQASAQTDPAVDRHVAHLLLTAGSPARAAAAFSALIARQPEDPDLYKGLGEAELETGEYRAAERAFAEALRHAPGDAALKKRIGMVAAVAELDPTPRRLRSAEKYRRSMNLVELAAAALRECGPPAPDSPAATLLARASQAAAAPAQSSAANEVSEGRLALAQALWRERMSSCSSPPSPDHPLPIVMSRLLN